MSIDKSNNENIPAHTKAYYEELASQEELYLEETEEEVRAILISDDPSMTETNNSPCIAESHDEQLDHAAEELITGDSDDPPLSEETVAEMLGSPLCRKDRHGCAERLPDGI
jgi:hypothetical protein